MKHYVFWTPEADAKLQQLITQAVDPVFMARVAREIDFWLAHDPHEFGESRYDDVRVAFVRPLGVQFEILKHPPTVIVLSVWQAVSRQ